ncbi:RES family NAD+ phosphorylase [Accumulibacter sp.]|uniref:RES family NAD+ phosphorylase n=1 Tax=Accumulibacter sp. TaxID=2053492 RepID=UPI001AD51F36|nr:RES family NAD+ phosphorylase [Accumulibacter sp.]MBN8514013.1 RES family NAD+ phosphorylase [Accumulibacter sp.]MBO3701453.1 RES family NAD+ phosphorylase [Accumulibacter sp.]
MNTSDDVPIACSNCFSDRGLRLDAERIGREELSGACPNCGATGFKKLPAPGVGALAHRFFVWGSMQRMRYGAAPLIQFNKHQQTSIDVAPWLAADVKLIERLLGVGFFLYEPRLWMIGEVEPLKDLQRTTKRQAIVDRVLSEYPERMLSPDESFYRVRISPSTPSDPRQYDSPPPASAGRGRLDSVRTPMLYASPDLEVCVHECRVRAEDDVFVATLAATKPLRLLDVSILLKEEGVSEFESLDMAVYMLFLAGKHSYKITRAIAEAARDAGFDGLVYPSYFSLLRIGQMPFQTTYGISHRRIPQYQDYEEAKAIPNLVLFGRPVSSGAVSVSCINRLILSRVGYEFHFGPTGA